LNPELDYSLDIRLDAIVNDSSSALLARAYVDPTTSLALILGTGVNAAVHLPIASLHPSKFGPRTMPADTNTAYVLTNTELSMFGRNILPMTRWDERLNNNHIHPDYQPFEYLIAGAYMGEIVRLIIYEATATVGLFSGLVLSCAICPKCALRLGSSAIYGHETGRFGPSFCPMEAGC